VTFPYFVGSTFRSEKLALAVEWVFHLKLWRWAVQLGHVAVDPMANIQPADKWGINAEHLTVASYTRLLRVVAGREPPSKGLEPTIKYQLLFPYFVLGGMAGLRTCELVRSEPTDPVLNWEDIFGPKVLSTSGMKW